VQCDCAVTRKYLSPSRLSRPKFGAPILWRGALVAPLIGVEHEIRSSAPGPRDPFVSGRVANRLNGAESGREQQPFDSGRLIVAMLEH